MTIDVKPELAAALTALASEKGLSVKDYLQQLLEKELPIDLRISERTSAA